MQLRNTIAFSFFLFFVTTAWSQSKVDTKIDFFTEEVSITQAIALLSEQTNIPISFSNTSFKTSKLQSHTFQQKSVRFILEQLLADEAVEYLVLGDQIILRPKAKALKKFTLSGYIQDASDGEKLIAATFFSTTHQKGTISNEYGFFSLTLPEGPCQIRCSYLGSQEKELTLTLTKDQKLNIELERLITLAEVEVRPFAEGGQQFFSTSGSADEFSIKHLSRIPDLGGEPDLLRAAQLLPGVQSGADGLGGLHIRGGNADQNLMLLDGVPIYNPTHLMGIYSVFNTSAIRDAKLIKGNFPARYGGRLSSVLDVRTREGNQKKWGGAIHTGLTSSNLSAEGPIAKGKGAILLSGRHSHSNFLFDTITRAVFFPEFNGPLSYRFYDLNGKVNFTLGTKDRLFFSFYRGGDQFRVLEIFEEEEEGYSADIYDTELSWGNSIGSFRWNHQFSDQLFANTTLTSSQYQYNNALFYEYTEEDDTGELLANEFTYDNLGSELIDYAAKIDFDYLPSPEHYIRFGGGLTFHNLSPSYNSFEGEEEDFEISSDSITLDDLDDFFTGEQFYSQEWFAYFEDEFSFKSRWKINAGLRVSGFLSEEINYANLEPRLGIRYNINDQWTIHGGISRMVQYLHRVAGIGISKPDDIWIPSNFAIEPQSSWQGGLGLEYRSSKDLRISIESYLKAMNNLVSFDDSTFTLYPEQALETGLVFGSGLAYGLEFLVKKDFGKSGGHFAYTFARATRYFPDLNLGIDFPFLFDRRHQVSLFLFHQFNKRWELTSNFLYGTSHPIIAIESNEDFELSTSPINGKGNKNGSRNRGYHRLDISLLYKYHRPRFQHTFKAGIYNAYNQPNEAFFRLTTSLQGEDILNPVSFMPLLPSLSYNLQF